MIKNNYFIVELPSSHYFIIDLKSPINGFILDKDAYLKFNKVGDSNLLDIGEQVFVDNDYLEIWINLTESCNLNCPYCYVNKSNVSNIDSTKLFFSIKSVEKYIYENKIKTLKVKFAGGEPLLNFMLLKKIHNYFKESLSSLGINYVPVVITNGTLINFKVISFFLQEKFQVAVSIDGVGEYHDRTRKFINGKSSYLIVLNSINKLNSVGIKPLLSSTISPENIDGLLEIIEFAFSANLPINLNFIRTLSSDSFDFSYIDKLKILIDDIEKLYLKYLPSQRITQGLFDRLNMNAPKEKYCNAGTSYFAIHTDGTFSECHMLNDSRFNSIEQAKNNSKANTNKISDDCSNCIYSKICAGGCPLNRRLSKNPYCEINKFLIPKVFAIEAKRCFNELELHLQGD